MIVSDEILHDGGPMPVPGDTLVLCRFRDEYDEYECGDTTSPAEYWSSDIEGACNWTTPDGSGIAAYRIVTP